MVLLLDERHLIRSKLFMKNTVQSGKREINRSRSDCGEVLLVFQEIIKACQQLTFACYLLDLLGKNTDSDWK